MSKPVKTFFHSDHHHMHKNILTFQSEQRPFPDLDTMTKAIIGAWNAVVGPDDKVFMLGDFCFGGKENVHIAGALNGKKTLIMGNHDHYPIELYLLYFKRVEGCVKYGRTILSHIPVHPLQLDQRFTLNLHGHLHSHTLPDTRYVNCCLDHIGLTPLTLDELINRNGVK